MEQKPSSEKNYRPDQFKGSDNKGLSQHKVNSPKNLSGASKPNSFLGSSIIKKSIFEKRAEGLTRAELRAELRTAPYDDRVKMRQKERIGLEKEMERGKYGENISKKDVDLHIKRLKKEESLSKTTQGKFDAKHKRVLLEKLREKKII